MLSQGSYFISLGQHPFKKLPGHPQINSGFLLLTRNRYVRVRLATHILLVLKLTSGPLLYELYLSLWSVAYSELASFVFEKERWTLNKWKLNTQEREEREPNNLGWRTALFHYRQHADVGDGTPAPSPHKRRSESCSPYLLNWVRPINFTSKVSVGIQWEI